MDWGKRITHLGQTALKEKDVTFGIKDEDRLRHFCVLGRAGSGRGELITQMALQDIERGLGTVVLDANGNAAPRLIERLEERDLERLVYLDPAEAEYPYSWNVLDDVRSLPEEEQVKKLTKLLRSIYRIYDEPFTQLLVPKMLQNKDSTVVTFYLTLINDNARERFFKDDLKTKEELEALIDENEELVSEIDENGRYIAKDTLVRNLLGQHKSKFTLDGLSEGSIVVVDMSRIKMFPTRVTPLVRVFVEAAHIACAKSSTPTSLYMHDCLRYLGENEIDWLFGSCDIALTVADTIVQEGDKERREMALSKCGSVASFASHPMDKALMERAFYPYIDPDELVHLEERELVVALTIDGVRTRPFFARISEMGAKKINALQDTILEAREKYTTSRTKVDEEYRASRDDEKNSDGPPGGFHDAFKSIFAKRAQGSPGTPPKTAAKPKAAPQEKTNKETKKEVKAREVPEDSLKQMLYVQPVAS